VRTAAPRHGEQALAWLQSSRTSANA